MSETQSKEFGLSDLNHNRLWASTDAKNRDVTLTLDVFNGVMNFSIWDKNKTGGPVFKMEVPPAHVSMARNLWTELKKANPGVKFTGEISKFNKETKKQDPQGSITYGIDDAGVPYIGIQHHQGVNKFPLRGAIGIDYAAANLPPMMLRSGLIDGFLDAVSQRGTLSTVLSNVKRPPMSGGNFNRGSGGGRFNRGSGGGYTSGSNNRFQNHSRPAEPTTAASIGDDEIY